MKRINIISVLGIAAALVLAFGCSRSHETLPQGLGEFPEVPLQYGTTEPDITETTPEEIEITPALVDKVEVVFLGGDVVVADMSRPFPRAIKAVRVTFTEDVDQSTAESIFSLMRDGLQVPGTFAWPDDDVLEFTPDKKSPYKVENVVALNGDELARYRSTALNDVNGDGNADIILGGSEQTMPPAVRSAYLFWGSDALTDRDVSAAEVRIVGEDSQGKDRFGYSPAVAGDLNADGFADIVIGAPNLNTFAGAAYIFFGSASMDALPQPLKAADAPCVIRGINPNLNIGEAIAAADDVDGDGYDDLLLSSYKAHGGLGEVYLFSGKSLVPSDPATPKVLTKHDANTTIVGEPGAYEFGKGIAAGHIGNDEYSDIIVGSPIVDIAGQARGRAYVFHGREEMGGSGLTIELDYNAMPPVQADITVDGPDMAPLENDPWFGHAIAATADMDGDGRDELVVGAPLKDLAPHDRAGAVYLFLSGELMSQSPPPEATNSHLRIWGKSVKETIGWSVSSAGRFNDDAYGDVIAGGPLWNGYYGRAARMLGDTYMVEFQDGQHQPMKFGNAVSVIGDINGDGYSDVMVGAPRLPLQFNGVVQVFLGNPAGTFSITHPGNFTIQGIGGNEQVGISMGGQLSH